MNATQEKQVNALDTFMAIYAAQLEASMRSFPDDYAYGLGELPKVLERMRSAVTRGSFNKDSPAFRKTCKELGIKHTYKAIAEYLR